MKLENKNILVTGASDGIGRSIAITLSKAGAHVILLARNEEKLESVAQECNGKTTTISCDITDHEKLKSALEGLIKENPVDILINNAGIWQKAGDVTSVDDQSIEDIISVNMTSHILITKYLLPSMRTRETAIVNVISKAGVVAQKGFSVYSASKYGMRGFTDVLREDTSDEPIRIAALYQAGTNTDMFNKSGQEGVPIEKFTEPNDLAETIRFMLSLPEKIWLKEVHVEF